MNWPAILQFEGCDELELIGSEAEWRLRAAAVGTDCSLITKAGDIYRVSPVAGSTPAVIATNKTLSAEQALILAQQHMTSQAYCCASKVYAKNAAEVMALIDASD